MSERKGSILVIGATGTVGSVLVSLLSSRKIAVKAATRRPRERTLPGVEPVRFDLEEPASFDAALAGVDRVFLIARPGDDHPERLAIPFIDAAVKRGVSHITLLSAMGVEKRDDMGLRVIEKYIESTALSWNFLRPNFFMQIFATPPLLTSLRTAGEIAIPAGEARLSFIDVRDIAAVATETLASDHYRNRAYTLTGPEPLSHDEAVRVISVHTGKSLSYRAIDEATARETLRGAGFSAERVERLIMFYRVVRSGACAPVDNAVERVLGRKAIPFERFVIDHKKIWL